ncbi:MAG: hypothetical protein JWO47_457 [Candidatus Saccharibacteria bacterium]|nr:hypothetical protein [Candidatus Saccharibacteria bacterium]
MELVKKAETVIGGWYKNAPKLSDKTKETLVKIWPWLALVFGILQLVAALALWRLVHVANSIVTIYGTVVNTNIGISGTDKLFIALGIILLIVDAVILLMAYPKLAKRQKTGWDLIFLGSLLNVVYSVITLLINGRGVSSFLSSLIGSAIGFYLIFQVREKFVGPKAAKTE